MAATTGRSSSSATTATELELLDPRAPLDLGLGDSRIYETEHGSLTVEPAHDGAITLRIAGIGRDQNEPESEPLAAWIARFEAPDQLARTWGAEWQVPSREAFVPLIGRMCDAGATLRERRFDVADKAAAHTVFELLVHAPDLERSWWWTWAQLQVELTQPYGEATRVQLRGYNYMARGDQRQPAWEQLADELATGHQVDRRFLDGGTRVLVGQDELALIGKRVFGLSTTPLVRLNASLRRP